jgi:PleD family two-component response regulator
VEDIIAHADQALLEAKAQGRNRVRVYRRAAAAPRPVAVP